MIRTLRDDEPIPDSTPARYLSSHGYVRLRWLVGADSYVEAYEHRVVMGRPEGQVHHIDGNKANNDRANLVVLTAEQHTRLHADQDRAAGKFRGKTRTRLAAERKAALDAEWAAIAARYALGFSTTELGRLYGRDASNISRGLRFRGYTLRPAGWSTAMLSERKP